MLVLARKADTAVLCYDESAGGYTIEVFKVPAGWEFIIKSSASTVRWAPPDFSAVLNLYTPSSEYSGNMLIKHVTSNQLKLIFDVAPSTIVLRRELLTSEEFITFNSGGGLVKRNQDAG